MLRFFFKGLLRVLTTTIFLLISWSSLSNVIRDALRAQRKHQREPKLKLIRSYKVPLTPDNERPSAYIQPSRGCLRDLISMHPVDISDDLSVPGSTVTDLVHSSLIQGDVRYRDGRVRVFNNGDSGTGHVGMHEQVTFVEVTLDERLILLSVLT